MGNITLTVKQSRTVAEATKSQQKRLFEMLEALNKSEIDPENLYKLEISKVEDSDLISFIAGYRNGALRGHIHIMIGKRGGLNHAESEYAGGTDYVAEYDKVSRAWRAIYRHLRRFP